MQQLRSEISNKVMRPIRSFVRRDGRITERQQRALKQLWSKYGLEITSTAFDFNDIFQRDNEKILDIGFGNGESLIANAMRYPDRDFVGIEVYRAGLGALLAQLCEQNITNVRVIAHDAVELLQQHVVSQSFAKVQLFFPDPWPKKRHHKRRIVQASFVDLIARVLMPGGYWHIATDWQPYAEHVAQLLLDCPVFSQVADDAMPSDIISMRPLTKFARRGLRLGHQLHDLIYQKRG